MINLVYQFQVYVGDGTGRMVAMTSEINNIVSYFYHKYKGDNSFKILTRIREHFVGIFKDRIQSFTNRNREHWWKYPIFSNKEDLEPIIAKQPMERCQIDSVVFEKKPSNDENGNIYKYVLSCLDLFFTIYLYSKMEIKRHNWRS